MNSFTASAVIAGLRAAGHFATAFGENALAEKYMEAANNRRDALTEYLYDSDIGRFLSSVSERLGVFTKEFGLDSSLWALFALGVFPALDEKIVSTMEALKEKLWCRGGIGGMARHENDYYQSVVPPSTEIPGNPWIVCTLWYAQYLIEKAKDKDQLQESVAFLIWVTERALRSGVLAEQVNPFIGEPVSVSPLTWSHATFIITVQQYLKKLEEMEKCPACGRSPVFTRLPSA